MLSKRETTEEWKGKEGGGATAKTNNSMFRLRKGMFGIFKCEKMNIRTFAFSLTNE